AATRLYALRARLGGLGGASALDEDLIVARIAAPDGYEMRRALVPALEEITGGALPRNWKL
ncbi:urease accessory protein UreD, partial [Litorisediminicola beolgyonensis]